jgi:hypothetical protein
MAGSPYEPAQPVEGWVVRPDVRHERLVWLAARPDLTRIHHKWWHSWTRILRAQDAPRRTMWIDANNSESEDLSASLERASLIIDDLAGDFIPEEREVLRRTGLLPRWFWPTYLEKFEAAKRR